MIPSPVPKYKWFRISLQTISETILVPCYKFDYHMHDQETEEIIGTSYQRKHSEHNKNSSIAVSI
jgi:hypothetical protein